MQYNPAKTSLSREEWDHLMRDLDNPDFPHDEPEDALDVSLEARHA